MRDSCSGSPSHFLPVCSLGNTWLARVYGGLNSRRALVVKGSSIARTPSLLNIGNVMSPPGTTAAGSMQHKFGPRMNRVLNDEVVAGTERLIAFAAQHVSSAAAVVNPAMFKIMPASVVPGIEDVQLPDQPVRLSFFERELLGVDVPEDTIVVKHDDAVAMWNRPFRQRDAGEGSFPAKHAQDAIVGGDSGAWEEAMEDFYVVKRVAELRQAKCAVQGMC